MNCDAVIVGAGAAGMATAIFAARTRPGRKIVLLDGAKKPGAKILVSGGGRCNVTNAVVTEKDFFGGSRNVIRRVLSALDLPRTTAFFREIGVALHEEPEGKLFPDTNQARTVLEALLRELARLGIALHAGCRVHAIEPGFTVRTSGGDFAAPRVVLATGGLSLPKTGSDGGGYELARRLGHTIVAPTPALAPLLLEGEFHAPLSGVSHEVEIRVDGERFRRPMLWTHFGASGPAAMDASRVWHRARLEGRDATMTADLTPGADLESALRPPGTVSGRLSEFLPARVAAAVLERLGLGGPLAHFAREDRRRLVQSVSAWPLPVKDSRGYNFAEATAGGVPLSEIDPATLESRRCPGLSFAGEILDVDGRIGGFNFQWAWSSGKVAGTALSAVIQ